MLQCPHAVLQWRRGLRSWRPAWVINHHPIAIRLRRRNSYAAPHRYRRRRRWLNSPNRSTTNSRLASKLCADCWKVSKQLYRSHVAGDVGVARQIGVSEIDLIKAGDGAHGIPAPFGRAKTLLVPAPVRWKRCSPDGRSLPRTCCRPLVPISFRSHSPTGRSCCLPESYADGLNTARQLPRCLALPGLECQTTCT